MVISLLLSDEFVLGLFGAGVTVVFAICVVAALLLVIKGSGYIRVFGLAFAWVLALVYLTTWDGGSGDYLSGFVLVSPFLFLLYKAFAWLFKWGK